MADMGVMPRQMNGSVGTTRTPSSCDWRPSRALGAAEGATGGSKETRISTMVRWLSRPKETIQLDFSRTGTGPQVASPVGVCDAYLDFVLLGWWR